MSLRDAILADKPTGYWPLDVDGNDHSGNGYNSTSGSPQYGYGSSGPLLPGASAAAEFCDASSTRMVLPAALLDPYNKWTFEWVFEPIGGNSNTPNGIASVMGITDASQQRDIIILDFSGKNLQVNFANTSSHQAGFGTAMNPDTAHHVVVSIDWTAMFFALVIDGIVSQWNPSPSEQQSRNHGGSTLFVGSNPDTWWGYAHMKISDIAIWSGSALTIDQAKAHYNAALPAFGARAEGLLVHDDFPIASPSWGVGATLAPARTGHVWTVPTQSKDALIRFGTGSNQIGLANANTSGPGQEICVVDAGVADCDIFGDIHFSPNRADTGLCFRVIDDDNYLLLATTINGVEHDTSVWKRDGGTFTQLSTPVDMTAITSLGGVARLHVKLAGNRLKVWTNDVLTFDMTLSAADQAKYGAATKHGVRVNFSPSQDDALGGIANFRILHPSGSYRTVY